MFIRNRITSVVLLFVVGSFTCAYGAVFYVDVDNISGVEDGLSWTTAFKEIQPAINAAELDGGGDVWVAEGMYSEPRTNLTGSLLLKSAVNAYGGFEGTETIIDQRDPELRVTVIDGSSARAGSSAYHVVVGADDSILDGFTISGGVADGPGFDSFGAGIFNDGVSPTLRKLVVRDNTADLRGAGIFNRASAAPTIEKCHFQNNGATDDGGAISNDASGLITVSKCIFNGNSAKSGAGIDHSNNSAMSISNCLFFENSATLKGGAIHTDQCLSLLIVNSTIASNSASSGGAIANDVNSTVEISNSILWGNAPDEIANAGGSTTTVDHSDVEGGYLGDGNIDADPLFRDASIDDYRLGCGSPCIDTGTSTGAPADDLLDVSRAQGDGFDMGAYEFENLAPSLELSVTPGILWPPNHKLVNVHVTATAADDCDAAPAITLVSVVSSEADDALGGGDGHTTDDVQNAATGSADFDVLLRAERSGSGSGRIYTLTYQVSDSDGNVTTVELSVAVPH
jgi:predicted outer membrane repeat protein